MLIKDRFIFLGAAASVLFFLIPVRAQQETIEIPLKLEPNTQSKIARSFFNDAMKSSDNEKFGRTPNGLLISAKRVKNNPDKFSVQVDTNGDGKLTDEKKILLSVNEKAVVEAKNTPNKIALPFELTVNQSKKGVNFLWKTNVQASGQIKAKNCSATIYLQDLNGDGVFEHSEDGTNLQIDRNNDGKIWGAEEWLHSREIIDFCGENFLITNVAPDGSSLTLERTNLQIAKVGLKTPKFELPLLNGKKITSDELAGKPILLDFWASWCLPCVEKLPEAKNLEKEISVFFINTDEKHRISLADEIITKNDLGNNSVMSGLGENDILWKTFARLNNSLPFYVLIDKQGTIVYAGFGGDELKELKAKIAELKSNL